MVRTARGPSERRARCGLTGLGWSVNWAGDRYSIHGEALANFGDSNIVSRTVGFRVDW